MKISSLAAQFRIAFFGLPIILIASVIVYTEYNQIENENRLKETSASQVSSLVGKVDRNFYERFDDVQAYAANVLLEETQPEEMCQNLEELSATQEEMKRKEIEYLNIIEGNKKQA